MKIENTGDGPALVPGHETSGQAPFKVTSKTKVGKLNADLIDGLDSSKLVQVPAKPLTAHVLSTDPASVPDTTLTDLGTYLEVYDPSDMHWAVEPEQHDGRRAPARTSSRRPSPGRPTAVGWRIRRAPIAQRRRGHAG